MNNNIGQQQQQQIKVDLNSADDVNCDECEGTLFAPVFFVKRLSALVSPTGEEVMVPVQTFQCAKCNHVNNEFVEKK